MIRTATLLWVAAATSISLSSAAPVATLKVGHMCCGGCESAVTAAAKSLPWVESVKVTQGTSPSLQVTAKPDAQTDIKALSARLAQAGFGPTDVALTTDDGGTVQVTAAPGPQISLVATPGTTVTATVGHMCCGGCAAAAKASTTKLPFVEKTEVDQAAKTITVTPKAGAYSLSALVSALEAGGFRPLKVTVSPGAQAALPARSVKTARR